MAEPGPTVVFRTLDCARRLRLHYRLNGALDERLWASFEGWALDVQRFSQFSPGAQDHFALARGQAVRLAGALGGGTLVATYGKVGGKLDPSLVADVAQRLCGAGFGPIVEEPTPAPSVEG